MFTFNINKDKFEIIIDERILLIPEFKDLYFYDTTKQKKKAKQMLLYLWIAYDITLSNPYRDLDNEERENTAMEIAYGSREKTLSKNIQEILAPAIKKYLSLSSTPEERLLDQLNTQINKQNEVLGGLDSMKENKDGEMVENGDYSKTLESTLKNIKDLLGRKDELLRIIKNDEGKMRGKNDKSFLESGILKVKSKFGK